jgi:alpha-1,2-mannosyltransferase
LVLLAIAAALIAVSVTVMSTLGFAFIDLEVYRFGVQKWLDGGDIYGSLPKTNLGISLPFIYPPFAAIALAPMALIPLGLSYVVNFGLSVAALGGTLYLAGRRLLPGSDRVPALLLSGFALPLALWLEPVRETMGFGQINLYLLLLVAADCLVEKPRWPRGLLIGIAAAIKLTPAVFVLYFLVRRDFRALLVTVVSGALATGLGFLVLPSESVRYWFGGFAGAGGLSGSPYSMNQTIIAALARLSLAPGLQNFLFVVIGALVLVAAAFGVWRASRAADPVLAMSVTAAAGLLLSPTSWSHHWVWIAPALLAMVVHSARTRSASWMTVTALTTVVFYVAVHGLLPNSNSAELSWNAAEHIGGDSYVLLTIALLVGYAIPALRPALAGAREAMNNRRARRGAGETAN